ncbi:MAG: hypothetical protein NT031_10875 [Planctomycetota bacterium]|nr:hypothetical protein [Planctomycetota bacterium]
MTTPPAQAAAGFSEEETVLIKSATDDDEYWQATPLFVLLKHAALLPDGEAAAAEKIDLNALWHAPQKYREKFKPVTFEGWYTGVCEKREGVAKEWWPAGTFYLMHVRVTTDKDSPIVLVAVTRAPSASLVSGTKLNFTGYFYKNARLPLQQKESEKRINPVLVAKAAEIGTLETAASRPFNSWGIVAAIVTLLGLGLYFQMRVRASRQQAAMHVRVQALTHQPEEDADFDVDPSLAQEVERFEAEQEAAHHPTDAQKAEEK